MQSDLRPLDSRSSLFGLDDPLYRINSTASLVTNQNDTQKEPKACPHGWWGSLVWRLQGGGETVPGWGASFMAIATSSWLNILLVNVPLAWTAAIADLSPLYTFILSFLAIVPLEKLSEFAGNQFALYCGETLGEFVSVTLANVVEVNLAMFLLLRCELRLVQATVMGVVLLHALLVPGVAFLSGGARVLEQKLKPVHTQLNATLLFLGVVTLLVPVAFFSAFPNPHQLAMVNATSVASPDVLMSSAPVERALLPLPPALNYVPAPHSPRLNVDSGSVPRRSGHQARGELDLETGELVSSDGVVERNPEQAGEQYIEKSAQSVAVSDKTRRGVEEFSHGYAIMLICVYILSRIYLHRHPLNDDLRVKHRGDAESAEMQDKPIEIPSGKRRTRVVGPGPVIILLLVVVVLIAVTAEFLISSVEHVQEVNQLSSEWFGLILLPMISYSADALVTVVYCCRRAWRRRTSSEDDLQAPEEVAQGRSIDLSIQFLLFWLPVLVIIAWITGKPLTLLFDVFEVAAVIGACLLVNYATQDGKTNWVEGVVLIVFYVMIALTAWFYNGQLSVFELLQCQSVDALVRAAESGDLAQAVRG